MKKVLILGEKYRSRVFNISTQELYEKVALSIIRGRKEAGWFDKPEPPESELTVEGIERLPKSLQAEAKRQLDFYQDRKKQYLADIKTYQDVFKCLETNDGKLAIDLLALFRDREYEGYNILLVHDSFDQV